MPNQFDQIDAIQDVRRIIRATEEEDIDIETRQVETHLSSALNQIGTSRADEKIVEAASKLAGRLVGEDRMLTDDALKVARSAAPLDDE